MLASVPIPPPAHGSRSGSRDIGLEESGPGGEAVALVHRDRPVAGMHRHPDQSEFLRQSQDGGDEPTTVAPVPFLWDDVHALHVTSPPFDRVGRRDPRQQRQPRHADHLPAPEQDHRAVGCGVPEGPPDEFRAELVAIDRGGLPLLPDPFPPQFGEGGKFLLLGRAHGELFHEPIVTVGCRRWVRFPVAVGRRVPCGGTIRGWQDRRRRHRPASVRGVVGVGVDRRRGDRVCP